MIEGIRATMLSMQSLTFTIVAVVSQPSLGAIADHWGLPAAYVILSAGVSLLMPWLEMSVQLTDEQCGHAALHYVETSLDRDHRRSKCLYQCSTCRCHSTGT
jgi:hypothetical protein